MINIIFGSILDAKEKYIAHQCNCVTTHAAGVAKTIFEKFPYSNVYKDREQPDELGSIKIMGNGDNERLIINMFAQHYPGRPKIPNDPEDGLIARQRHFYSCLVKIAQIPDLESVAFPYGIGCNLGGGDWLYYSGYLGHFAKYVNEKFGTRVTLYHKGD